MEDKSNRVNVNGTQTTQLDSKEEEEKNTNTEYKTLLQKESNRQEHITVFSIWPFSNTIRYML